MFFPDLRTVLPSKICRFRPPRRRFRRCSLSLCAARGQGAGPSSILNGARNGQGAAILSSQTVRPSVGAASTDSLLKARQPLRRLGAHEERINERPVVAVPTARLRGRGRHHHDLWLSGGQLAPSPIILSRQPPIEVTEDDQRPSGLQATVDPCLPGSTLVR